jgi:hypothetical protein
MWVGCSTLYWVMFVPAFLNSAPAAGAAAAPALAAFSQVCVEEQWGLVTKAGLLHAGRPGNLG